MRRLVVLAVVVMAVVVAIVLARGVRDAAADARSEAGLAGHASGPGDTESVPQAAGPRLDTSTEPGPAGAAAGDAQSSAAPAQPSGESPSTDDSEWWAVLDDLDERRAHAIAQADPQAIGSYAVASSPFGRSEAEVLGQLSHDRLRPRGWGTTVVAIENVDGPRAKESGQSVVVLTVVDVRSAFELVDEAGTVVRSVPMSAKRRWHITLTRPLGATPSGSAAPTVEGDRAGSAREGQDQAEDGSGSGANSGAAEGLGAPGVDQGLDDARSAVADDHLGGQSEGADEATDTTGRRAADEGASGGANAAVPGAEDSPAAGDSGPNTQQWRIVSVELRA